MLSVVPGIVPDDLGLLSHVCVGRGTPGSGSGSRIADRVTRPLMTLAALVRRHAVHHDCFAQPGEPAGTTTDRPSPNAPGAAVRHTVVEMNGQQPVPGPPPPPHALIDEHD